MCGKKGNIGKNVSPDIISLTSVIACLERGEGKEKEEQMDAAFATAVERQIILPQDSMDTKWEIDLSGMSLPVARAACRFIIKRLQQDIKEGENYQDLMLITGVGKHHYESDYTRKQKDENDDFSGKEEKGGKSSEQNNSDGRRTPGTTSLREYVQQTLQQDFKPPIYSVIPDNAGGVLQVKKEMLQKWNLDGEQQD